MVIATDATLTHWDFYFQRSGLPLLVSGSWSSSICRAHIALQELQAIAMMLHRMAFHLSGKVVSLHLDNSTTKAYLCNQGCTVSPFLSRLACQILSLTDKHDISLIPVHITNHLNAETDYLSQDRMLPEWHLLPQVAQAVFHLWGLPEVHLLASSHSTQCQDYYTLEYPLSLGAVGLNAFNRPWMFQVSYVFHPPELVPLVLPKFLAEYVKSDVWFWWHHVGWRLLGSPQFSTCWQTFLWQCFTIKDLIIDVLVGQALKGLPYLHLTLWLLIDVCYADRFLLLGLSGSGGGTSSI